MKKGRKEEIGMLGKRGGGGWLLGCAAERQC